MSLSDCVLDALGQAMVALEEASEGKVANPRLLWLERQLANIIAHLNGLLSSLDDGWGLSELGFFSEDDFVEMVGDLSVEIANLKGMIRTLKSLGLSL